MENTSFQSYVVDGGNDSTTSVGLLESDANAIYDKYLPGINSSPKYVRIILYVFGYPGNLLAFLVWIRKPMLQSSGCYLAALSMSDLMFLLLDLVYTLQTEWGYGVVNFPLLCEAFTVSYMTAQYTSPLLTLGFTTERYIAIKFPLKRRIYCTLKRAIATVICLAILSLSFCGIQGYFWTFDRKMNECLRREETARLWESWTWSTEMIMFLGVPIIILALNILVICEIRKSRKIALKLNRILYKTTATTTMLLAVSFFLILTTLPVSIAYALSDRYPPGETNKEIPNDPVWQAHFSYYEARTIIYNIGLTHFVLNFYIYLIAGDRFRREVLIFLRCKKSARNLSKIHSRSETTKLESFYSSDTF